MSRVMTTNTIPECSGVIKYGVSEAINSNCVGVHQEEHVQEDCLSVWRCRVNVKRQNP